jgi:peptidyl-prolyl cis-trans isomerase C
MKKCYLAGWIGALLILAGCGGGGGDGANPPAATVNGRAISSAELEREIARFPDPSGEGSRRRALEILIDRRLLLDEAEKTGITRLPELRDLWEAQVIDRLLRDRLGNALEVSDTDVADFYADNHAAFVASESRRVRQIVTGEEWEAEKIRERLRNGGDFARLAQDHSLEPFAVNYGDLGYIERKNIIPELAAAAFSLPTGVFSPPLRTRFGYHVIEVLDVRPARRETLAETSDAIREHLIVSRREELVGGWLGELRSAAAIEIVGEGLRTPPAAPPGRE